MSIPNQKQTNKFEQRGLLAFIGLQFFKPRRDGAEQFLIAKAQPDDGCINGTDITTHDVRFSENTVACQEKVCRSNLKGADSFGNFVTNAWQTRKKRASCDAYSLRVTCPHSIPREGLPVSLLENGKDVESDCRVNRSAKMLGRRDKTH